MELQNLDNSFIGYWIITFLISYEAILWGWTLNRHGRWQAKHPNMDKRSAVSARMLQMAAGMSAIFSLFMWFLFMYTLVISLHYKIHANFWIFMRVFILIGIQLTHIHFSAIVARYCCLPRSMWPVLSRVLSIVVCKVFKFNPPALTSAEVHRCYNKRCDPYESHKK